MNRQLPLFGAKRACFFSFAPESARAFSAYTPKAVAYFARKFDLPIIFDPTQLDQFGTVFFSLHCFRDFYSLAALAKFKRPGQEWIAGGNACATPTGVSWIMDFVWVGDCRASFALILRGERELPGLLDMRRAPTREIEYVDEDITDEELSAAEFEVSKGCPRRCLFCIHPWRHRYQEAPKQSVLDWIASRPRKGLGLMSNSSDDVSYYGDIDDALERRGKTDMTVSNAIQGITPEFVARRKRELFFGIEGFSERLRWIVNKPIPRADYHRRLEMCLAAGRQIRTVYQFNLPSESDADYQEFLEDLSLMRGAFRAGSWSVPVIPNQPSAHTPFQWVEPHYDLERFDALMALRQSFFGSRNGGIAVYMPAPLGPARWFAQVIAEWVPITPVVARAVRGLPKRANVRAMAQYLDTEGVRLPPEFFRRERETRFPWSHIKTTGDYADKWRAFERMVRKVDDRQAGAAQRSPA